jgi:hypothetical protein
MADEGLHIALVGSAVPKDEQGSVIDDPAGAQERKIREACKALGRALAATGCRLIVYSSEPEFIEADIVGGYAETAKTPGSIRFVCPEDNNKKFVEQDHDRTRPLFHVERDGSRDWEMSFYQTLEQADGVILVCGGRSTLIAGHVAMILGRPIAPIGVFNGAARKLRNHLVQIDPDLPQVEKQALSEFDSGDAALVVVSGLRRRCEALAESRRQADEALQQLKADQQQLAQLKSAERDERDVRRGAILFGLVSAVLLVAGLGVELSRVVSIALFMAVLAAGGGLGACLRLTRPPGAGKPSTAIVFGAIAGAVFSLSYMVPHWMSSSTSGQADPFTLGTTPSASLRLVMTWLVALGGGLAADAVIDSLRSAADRRAQSAKLELPAAPSVAGAVRAGGAAGAAAAPATRKKNKGRA